jgi:hypothetical protein
VSLTERPEAYAEARESIQKTVSEPMTKLLLNHSHLSLVQLETLLADSISSEKTSKKSQRRLFRPTGKTASRGAYNRTLIQAQNNVIRSIYTILVMGYVGLFDTSGLQPFLELSDNLQTYAEEVRAAQPKDAMALEQLGGRLWETISALARRESFKDLL